MFEKEAEDHFQCKKVLYKWEVECEIKVDKPMIYIYTKTIKE